MWYIGAHVTLSLTPSLIGQVHPAATDNLHAYSTCMHGALTYIASLEVEEISGATDFELVLFPSLPHPLLLLHVQVTFFVAHCRLY